MLTEILMESLLSMDENTLDSVLESCSNEELEIIDSAVEALSDQDKADFKFINKIQRDASSKGWGNVPKEDRDKFVNIMSNTKNLDLLKKATTIGKREASYDDNVKSAMKALGAGAIGAGFGAMATKKAINDQMTDLEEIKGKLSMPGINGKAAQRDINSKIADLKDFITTSNGKVGSHEITRARREIGRLNRISEKLSAAAGNNFDNANSDIYTNIANTSGAKLGELQGSAIGAGIGMGVGAGLAALKKYKKYNRDRNDVMAQGDSDHPNNRWKKNRKDAELRSRFSKMRKDILTNAEAEA